MSSTTEPPKESAKILTIVPSVHGSPERKLEESPQAYKARLEYGTKCFAEGLEQGIKGVISRYTESIMEIAPLTDDEIIAAIRSAGITVGGQVEYIMQIARAVAAAQLRK